MIVEDKDYSEMEGLLKFLNRKFLFGTFERCECKSFSKISEESATL